MNTTEGVMVMALLDTLLQGWEMRIEKYLRWLLLLGSGGVRSFCEDVFTLFMMMICWLGMLETWYYWTIHWNIYFLGL